MKFLATHVLCLGLLSLGSIALAAQAPAPTPESAVDSASDEPAARWWRGNLNAHSLWGAGDALPEEVLEWYRSHDYDFALVGDVPQSGIRWVPITADGPLTNERVMAAKRKFGAEVIRVRTDNGLGAEGAQRDVRLATLPDLERRFNSNGHFLVLPGLEQHFEYEDRSMDFLSIGIAEHFAVERHDEGLETIRSYISAVDARAAELGRVGMPMLQRPNFTWGGRLNEMVDAPDGFALEIANGHPLANQKGDREHWSLEYLWFNANSMRIPRYEFSPLIGFGGDDARNWFDFGPEFANAGRVWIQVRSKSLDADSLITAMRQRDFYVSSGVELTDIQVSPSAFRIDATPPADGRDLLFRFLGSRRKPEGDVIPDQALFETTENPAIYFPVGDELYLRAEVLLTRKPGEDMSAPWTKAWTQAYEPYE